MKIKILNDWLNDAEDAGRLEPLPTGTIVDNVTLIRGYADPDGADSTEESEYPIVAYLRPDTGDHWYSPAGAYEILDD